MNTAICTLAVGRHTEKDCHNLIESVKKNTGCEVYVYNAENVIDYENITNVEDVTDVPLNHVKVFNYNLKGIVTNHCYNNTDHDRIIFCDSDIMITEKTDLLETIFDECDFCAKFERFTSTHKLNPTWRKYQNLMKVLKRPEENFFEGMVYSNESFFICNRTDRTDQFLKHWSDICVQSSKHGLNPAFECVELGVALHDSSGLHVENLRGGVLKDNMMLVTRHRGKYIQVIRR